MNYAKTVVASALLAATGVAQAELSANIGAVSDYVFRGITLNGDSAIQGGVDYAADSGFYAGTWMSPVAGAGTELDLYTGFGGEAGSVGYDIGAFYFAYPESGGDNEYLELVGSLSFGPVTATLGYTPWEQRDSDVDAAWGEGDLYYSLGADFPMDIDGFSLSGVVGYYDFDDDGETGIGDISYTHWQLALSKDAGDFGTFTLYYDQTDLDDAVGEATLGDDGQAKFTVGWGKDF